MGLFEHIFLGDDDDNNRKQNKEKAPAEMEGENGTSVPSPLLDFSSIADSVINRCCRILTLSVEQVQQSFEAELPEHSKEPSYARNLVEYCCYKALRVETQRPDHLADKEFSLLTFDMMLAWEAPDTETESLLKENACSNYPEVDDDEGSLFYASATRMASQIDGKETVGPEAFAQIAPACAAVADSITVHNLFHVLTSSSGGRLHFLIYDKYIKSLYKVLKSMKHLSGQTQSFKFDLADGEIILDIDAKSALHHNGSSSKSGRLTLTSHALYFEASGITSFDKATEYDLSKDSKQVVKRKLTGPWGARLFDKAIMYKSDSVTEPIFLEFSQFSGHSHRDYWFSIIQEILHVHKFIRKYNLKKFQRAEILSSAALGIFRCRAVKEAFHTTPSDFKSILAFNLAEKLPKGDKILGALYNHLELMRRIYQNHSGPVTPSDEKPLSGPLPGSLHTLTRMGFPLLTKEYNLEENEILVGNIHVGQTCPLQAAVRESFCYTGRVEAARATLYQVKMEDIATNLAVIKDLLFPLSEMGRRLQSLASWEDSFKSRAFLFLILYILYRGWVRYTLPCIFLSLAVCMFWHKHHNNGKPVKIFEVSPPPHRSTVELLVMLQDGVSLLQTNIQTGTIALLKLRALLLAFPQTTTKVAGTLVFVAAAFCLVPFRHLLTLVLLEIYTRRMPLRRESSEKLVRRVKEWWSRIPAAPIHVLRPEEQSNSR
ncbi:hypothetical protein Cni_G27010 [Canna indica]|uniref:Uncharacterized protein n=1 Tax=Canna indica TaxID=4628 RepID=A0AAQ3L349_9LILI|nr:hypothetical protein Cni_G27010 [Canna indica]